MKRIQKKIVIIFIILTAVIVSSIYIGGSPILSFKTYHHKTSVRSLINNYEFIITNDIDGDPIGYVRHRFDGLTRWQKAGDLFFSVHDIELTDCYLLILYHGWRWPNCRCVGMYILPESLTKKDDLVFKEGSSFEEVQKNDPSTILQMQIGDYLGFTYHLFEDGTIATIHWSSLPFDTNAHISMITFDKNEQLSQILKRIRQSRDQQSGDG